MKNKDSQMIRDYMNLIESIENKLSSDDDVVEENTIQPINEFNRTWVKTFSGDANALKSAEPALYGAFTDVLSFAKGDKNQIIGLTAKSPNKFVPIKNIDDLLYALRTDRGMTDATLALFNQGLLKSAKTPANIINDIAKEVVGSQTFVKNYGAMTPKQMEIALKNKGYSDNAIKSLMENAKKDKTFSAARAKGVQKRKNKKTQSGKDKNLNATTNGTGVTQTEKNILSKRAQELLDIINNKKWGWKKILTWGAGIGIGALALWWWIFDNSDTVPEDMPDNEPTVGGQWSPCLQDLINNKSGVVTTTKNGEIYVMVSKTGNPEYDKMGGIRFYSNGRVWANDNSKKGTWSCKGGKTVVNEMSLNEQSAQIDSATMQSYVDTAVNDLDGWVDSGNLASLKKIITNLKGKTFNGKDAISEFLKFYKADEGDDFTADVQSVGVKTVGVQGITDKEEILNLVKGGGSSSATTPGNLGGIDIIWDGDKKVGGGSGGTKKKSIYKECTNFPYVFGCKSEIIREVQKCLGMEEKYQTGNFGPITLQYLETKRGEKVITKEVYDSIMKNCKQSVVTTSTGDTQTQTGEPTKTGETTKTDGSTPTQTGEPTKTGETTKTDGSTPTQPEEIKMNRAQCVNLFSEIDDNDQEQGTRTATELQRKQIKFCLQQYNFGIGSGAAKIKRRYGYTASGGDRGIK